jgi:hypothetical protein
MATATWTANKDTTTADNGTSLGAGAQNYLPIGNYSGYNYRALIAFAYSFAGIISIESAILHMRVSDQNKVAFGSDPDIDFYRLTSAFTEGSATSLSASNATTRANEPGTGAHAGPFDVSTTQNAWVTFDITNILQNALSLGVFYGLSVRPNTNATSDVTEFWSRESGGAPYIVVTYTTNRAPNVPTVSSPDVANGGLVGTTTPTLNVNMTDPDGDAINQFNWQIDDNSDFSSPIQDVYSGSPVGASGITVGVVPAALSRGGTYYFRARAADVSVWGNWSTTFQFKVASFPTLIVSEPSGAGRLARIQYDAGSGWVSPRMLVNWAMTCPDGGSQATWRVEVNNDASGAPGSSLNDATANDTTAARIVPATLTEGAYYHVRVSATCSHGLTTVFGFIRVRVRWGMAAYVFDMGATAIGSLALTTLDATDSTNGGQGKAVIEYMTAAAAGLPATWSGTVGGAGLARYFYYRVWLLVWGASPAVSPTLNQLSITYTTSTIVPDKWAITDAANQSGDVSSFVYGTKSLRMKGKGAGHAVTQVIDVVPGTKYVLSGRIQTSGAGKGRIDLLVGGVTVADSGQQLPDIEFEDPRSRVATPIWDSGNNTQVTVRCVDEGAVGTTAWFDALKLEASTVVTPWAPGYIADAVVLDAGGLQIDASQGGIFRLKGSAGGARDIVELGVNGLKFGGSEELWSPNGGQLQTRAGVFAPYVYAYGDRGAGALTIGGDGASGGKWAKLATGTIAGQYWSQGLRGRLMGRYGPSEIDLLIASDPGPAAQPSPVGLYVRNVYSASGVRNFRVVVLSLNPIVWELWFQSPGGYESFQWFPTESWAEGPNPPTLLNPGAFGWFAAPPAGTAYNAVFGQQGDFGVSGNVGIGGNMTVANVDSPGHGWFGGSVNANGGLYDGNVRAIEPAGLFIQRGTWSIPANGGSLTITFPVPFNASFIPTCMASLRSGSRGYIVATGGQNNTVMSIVVGTNGGAVPTVALSGDWIAVGQR